jgi:DNA-binding MarR family transcriptional regulator
LQRTTMSSLKTAKLGPEVARLEEESIVSAIVGIGKLLSAEFRQIAADCNLSDCLAGTLWHVHRLGQAKASDLARSMACDMGNLSGALNRLESAGFIERVKSSADRRVRLMQLSSKGEKLIAQLEARFKKTAIHAELARMNSRERNVVNNVLSRIFAGLSSSAARSSPTPSSQLRRIPA